MADFHTTVIQGGLMARDIHPLLGTVYYGLLMLVPVLVGLSAFFYGNRVRRHRLALRQYAPRRSAAPSFWLTVVLMPLLATLVVTLVLTMLAAMLTGNAVWPTTDSTLQAASFVKELWEQFRTGFPVTLAQLELVPDYIWSWLQRYVANMVTAEPSYWLVTGAQWAARWAVAALTLQVYATVLVIAWFMLKLLGNLRVVRR